MKNSFSFNLVLFVAFLFSFSFAAVAETPIKTDTETSINILQTPALPAAVAIDASPDYFTGAISDTSKSSGNFLTTNENQKTFNAVAEAGDDRAVAFRPDKRLSKQLSIVTLNRRFAERV